MIEVNLLIKRMDILLYLQVILRVLIVGRAEWIGLISFLYSIKGQLNNIIRLNLLFSIPILLPYGRFIPKNDYLYQFIEERFVT